jgi:hypothetical protein
MQIELDAADVQLIDKALEAWEREPQTSGMMSSLFSSIASRDRNPRDLQDERKKTEMEVETEIFARRVKSTLLRAKLFQTLSPPQQP